MNGTVKNTDSKGPKTDRGMIRGAIFDVDGTLLDSMSVWDHLGEDYLRSLGLTPEENLSQILAPMSLVQAAEYFQQGYGVKASTEEILNGIQARLVFFYREQAQLKPGAAAFLRKLQEKGIKMCIATATEELLVDAALRRCGIRDCFSEIFTCTKVGHSKNEPDIFRAAGNHLGTKKTETYVFEDAFHAAKTAKTDGFPVVAVYDPSEPQQEQLHALADICLRDFSDFDSFWQAEF